MKYDEKRFSRVSGLIVHHHELEIIKLKLKHQSNDFCVNSKYVLNSNKVYVFSEYKIVYK